MMNKKFYKSEKGSITVYVLVAMLFILALVFGRYLLANRQLQTQITAVSKVKSIYESNIKEYNNGEVEPEPEPSTTNTNTNTTNNTVTPVGDKIEIEVGGSPIPLYNFDTLKYFLDGDTGPYYIYQEGKNYYISDSTIFKLCFDITIPDSRTEILSFSGSSYNFSTKYHILNNLDFNNHCIYTSDGFKIFNNNNNINFNSI